MKRYLSNVRSFSLPLPLSSRVRGRRVTTTLYCVSVSLPHSDGRFYLACAAFFNAFKSNVGIIMTMRVGAVQPSTPPRFECVTGADTRQWAVTLLTVSITKSLCWLTHDHLIINIKTTSMTTL